MGEENNKENNQDNNKEYEFVTETIKKKPVNKKRAAIKLIYSIVLGIIAGFVACLIFAVFAPKIYTRVHPDEPDLITIPEDEQIEYSEGIQPEDIVANSDDEKLEIEEVNIEKAEGTAEADLENVKDNENQQETESEEKTESDSEKESADSENDESNDKVKIESEEEMTEESDDLDEINNEVSSQVIIKKEPMTLDDYKAFYFELGRVANVAKRSLTKVRGVTESTDWFKNSYESGNVSSGLILADNGKELLIITNSSKLEYAKDIEVTFCDGTTYKGAVKKSDYSTDLVVVAVALDDIAESTKNSYAPATLGNSSVPTVVGLPVIAIGSPLGIEDSMAMGVVTSNTRTLEHTDNNIRYLTTDIYGSTEGSGVLISLEGNVLGIIFQGGTSSDTKNLVHAYSISDIKSKIEKMSNGQETAYLGIVGTDVTKEAIDSLGVPKGAYVKQVVVDSPAIKGGIQNGDVIVKIGTSDITSFKDFKDVMNKSQPGDIAVVTVKRLGKDGYVEFSYEIYLEALK